MKRQKKDGTEWLEELNEIHQEVLDSSVGDSPPHSPLLPGSRCSLRHQNIHIVGTNSMPEAESNNMFITMISKQGVIVIREDPGFPQENNIYECRVVPRIFSSK